MLVKLGVDISRLNREIRRTLLPVEKKSIRITGTEAIITSTYEGDHLPSSLHYRNDAYDTRRHKKYGKNLCNVLKQTLGKNFDVILARKHIHIEYDPK